MSSPIPVKMKRIESSSSDAAGSLDVSWLLPAKKEYSHQSTTKTPLKVEVDEAPPPAKAEAAAPAPAAGEPTPPQSPQTPPPAANDTPPSTQEEKTPTKPSMPSVATTTTPTPPAPVVHKPSPSPASPQQNEPQKPQVVRPQMARGPSNDENKSPAPKGPIGNLKNQGGRRSSWISNLSSKFSSTPPTTPRSASVDAVTPPSSQPPLSPKVEFGNPFNKKEAKKEGKKEKKEEVRTVVTHTLPARRQSVLVAAGQETKLENPGFLSSAFRRLSSSNNVTLGKAAGIGAMAARRVMNVDQNRERVKISELDQNKLKRVAFCVDVEIAGYAAHGDDDDPASAAGQLHIGQRQSLASLERMASNKKEVKLKEKGEGAALKNPKAATEEKEEFGETKVDLEAAADAAKTPAKEDEPPAAPETTAQSQTVPTTTRKKEKKKRSEAERKDRRERKRRHAEANGLVPLELTGVNDDDDSDSSPSNTPPGASTPNRKPGEQPTTDPLRIYKRCCQLRETVALDRVKEQISKPSASLAESPGVVGIVDLSGSQMALQDVITLGDWLAVVPVRKLVLDDCGLTDEALRIILSGLVGCKSAEQAKLNRRLPKRGTGRKGQEQLGVIEKLSLKNNTTITVLGWKHIALFLHISRSLRAIDLSGIPFPKRTPESSDLSRSSTASSTNTSLSGTTVTSTKPSDFGTLFARALSERFGGEKLEELILSRCNLRTSNVAEFVDSAIKCKIRRLGLADNNLAPEALTHIVRYVKSGICEGLDLGGNDLRGSGHLLSHGLDEDNPLFAVSLAECNLTPKDVEMILRPFCKLKNFKFIDLSRNKELFNSTDNAVPVFRKYLPRLQAIKRIHLCDVDMTSDQVISLAEIFPDCSTIAHISILDNAELVKAMNSTENGQQEEACAFFASLMTAVRVSKSIIAIEIEVPNAESSEVVRALASQVVAYSLRNMEHGGLEDLGIPPPNVAPDKDAPEVLLHLVGHMDGYSENHDDDQAAPNEDYLIASTGIVKALSVCLGSKSMRSISPTASGTATPRQGAVTASGPKRPKDVTIELCESARKIRMRLRPALIKEDREGNHDNYRRLLYVDSTLERMIHRFEDEYPETKIPSLSASPPAANGTTSLGSSLADQSMLSGSYDLSKVTSDDYPDETPFEEGNPYAVRLSRSSSNTSLAAKALNNEEGRMLRFGQSIRRDLLRPSGMDDYAHGTSTSDPPEPAHLAALREKLETIKGEEIRSRVEAEGPEKVLKELGINAEELLAFEKEDPVGFESFRKSQQAAQVNSGMLNYEAVTTPPA